MKLKLPFGLLLLASLLVLAPLPASACKIQSAVGAHTPMEFLTRASNDFGFRLYRALLKEKPTRNQFLSPYSIWTALTMTSEGTGGSSLEILEEMLGLPDKKDLHAGLAALQQDLSKADAPYALATANAIWPEQSINVRPEFQRILHEIYDAECIPQPYTTDFETARLAINHWVEGKTNDRIKDLLPFGSLNPLTAMVLTNAIFFKAQWKYAFNAELSQLMTFSTEEGQTVNTNMMHLAEQPDLRYVEMDGVQALELPYAGDALSMLIVLPRLGEMSQLEEKLDTSWMAGLQKGLQAQKANVWLPRFKMALGGSIKAALIDLGMEPLFTGANFDPMFEKGTGLKVSDVFHKAFVEVNEEGTEAAAATAVVISFDDAINPEELLVNFRADHPFLFIIQHNASKSILFMGKVTDPSLSE